MFFCDTIKQKRTTDMQNHPSIRVLSIGLGILLLFHGVHKVINGVDPIVGMLSNFNVPYAHYVAYGVFVGEIIAPLMLIVGRYVRIAGALIAVTMASAITLAHSKEIFTLNQFGAPTIELALLYLIGGLSLMLINEKKF
jgi:putative oxidoreductase